MSNIPKRGGVTAVVGGQFGSLSEGKGLVVGQIAHEYAHHVRVGAANAGHTVWTRSGTDGAEVADYTWEKHVMQQVPCAAYANPEAELYIGPGAQITPSIFHRELDVLVEWRREHLLPEPIVWVDHRAHVITEEHVEREAATDLAERIGSTSTTAREGIGAAQAARVMREEGCLTAGEYYGSAPRVDVRLGDVPRLLDKEDAILLEGTQGTGLSLTTGPFPYVTSRNTTAAGLLADCGVAPQRLDRCILVCRTYPIRVAGKSGPFHEGSEEIRWDDLGVDPDKERTTVTKKVRRVATMSLRQVYDSVVINGPTEIALTFTDYLDKSIAGASGYTTRQVIRQMFPEVSRRIAQIESSVATPVRLIGTGPYTMVDTDVEGDSALDLPTPEEKAA